MKTTRQNAVNLSLALGALFLVSGCFCRSDEYGRSDDQGPPSNTAPVPVAPSSSDKKSTSAKNADKGDFIVEHLEVTTTRYIEIDNQVKS